MGGEGAGEVVAVSNWCCVSLKQSSCYRLCRRSTSSFLDSVRYAHDTFSKNPSTSAGVRITNEELPTKEQLFYVDFLTDTLVPGFLSNRKQFLKFMKLCTKDVAYSDSIFNQHTKGIDKFIRRISLSKLYFSLMQSTSKFEKLGSCIYENSDVVVVLWRIMAIKLYHQQTDIVEGALDIHLDKDGRIYKINNRPITRNDQDDASALSKLKEASKTANGEALATTVQMRTTLRCLLPLAAPSSAYFLFSRAYSNGRGNRGPEMFQLEHVRKRLEMTVTIFLNFVSCEPDFGPEFLLLRKTTTPHFFRERLDYTFYRPDVLYKDEIFLSAITGREKLMIYFGSISVICLFCFPHIEMEVLNILPISEDGTVRLRWRIKHISLIRSLLNPMLFKYDYRIKKTIDDEQKTPQANRLADLAQKVGVLPKGSATFVTDKWNDTLLNRFGGSSKA
ncbi:unnamed protein product [Wuchereria bancrofti]|uniref:Uncharacterized protein n=1 Tax=Wuchereria bancrofti TaxID=6293 RepID=A0A3P7FHM4_WUCBA|nr:unnamed protein product [Wuchereria bancrofti]